MSRLLEAVRNYPAPETVPDHRWIVWWSIWLTVLFGTFMGPELYAIVTGQPHNTLSSLIWHWEKLKLGEPFLWWTFGHYMITAILAVLCLWFCLHVAIGFGR